MKKNYANILCFFLMQSCFAGLNVNMFSHPDTIVCTGNAVSYYLDFNTDGVDDVYFRITCNPDIGFWNTNGQDYEAQYINGQEAIAYNCGAAMQASTTWSPNTYLATGGATDYQFDGKGPRYLAIRKYKYTNGGPYYEYGWIKIACSQDGSQLIVYGWAHSDVANYIPNIRTGEGECYTGISELELPVNTITHKGMDIIVNYPEPLTVRLFDITGRSVQEYNFDGGRKEYDAAFLNKGLYLVEVRQQFRQKTIRILLQ